MYKNIKHKDSIKITSKCILITEFFTQKIRVKKQIRSCSDEDNGSSIQTTLTQWNLPVNRNWTRLNENGVYQTIVKEKKSGVIQQRKYKNKHPKFLNKKKRKSKIKRKPMCITCRTYKQCQDSQYCDWCMKK